MKNKKKQH